MYKSQFHFQRKALRFRQFSRKRYALFACLGRVVTIGVLSVATLQSATAAHRHVSTDEEQTDTTRLTDKEAAPIMLEIPPFSLKAPILRWINSSSVSASVFSSDGYSPE